MPNNNRCVFCDEIIPEGAASFPNCIDKPLPSNTDINKLCAGVFNIPLELLENNANTLPQATPITIIVTPKRIHKNKRIQKKWLRRYGIKIKVLKNCEII